MNKPAVRSLRRALPALVVVAMLSPGVTRANAALAEPPCASLMSLALPGVTWKVMTADMVAAGPTKAAPRSPSVDLPEHCVLRAEISPRTGVDGKHYGIGFELRLPTAWNGKFFFQGGGGMDGLIRPAIGTMPNNASTATVALARGYAVASTDAGHEGTDGSFGADQQARIDYYYGAIDEVTRIAQRLLPLYYGQPLKRSYFVGCSNGGRQALLAAQRFPLMFDGVISGDPAFDLTKAGIAEIWEDKAYLSIAPKDAGGSPIISRTFSEADLKLVSDAVAEKCDGLDGLKDGLIENPRACHFDPAVLTCKGDGSTKCLTRAQVNAMKTVFGGPKASDGKAIYSDWPYDTGISAPDWRRWMLGTADTAKSNAQNMTLGVEATKSIHRDVYRASLDIMNFDFDSAVRDSENVAGYENATYTAMTSFYGHGGKLILFTGMSDPIFSPNDLIRYFHQVQIDNGGVDSTDAWARLFLIPGMTHCGGGPALDDFDPLAALEGWVENGNAPNSIDAKGKSFPGRTRNLCPFPQYPHYLGTGSVDDATNFVCKQDAP